MDCLLFMICEVFIILLLYFLSNNTIFNDIFLVFSDSLVCNCFSGGMRGRKLLTSKIIILSNLHTYILIIHLKSLEFCSILLICFINTSFRFTHFLSSHYISCLKGLFIAKMISFPFSYPII